MSPRKSQTMVGLAVIVAFLGAATLAAPVAATDTDTTAVPVNGDVNRTFNGTATSSATRTADGGLVLGGTTGFGRANATLTKLAADGSTEWTRQYDTTNRSGVVAVESGPDDTLYFLQYAYERTNGSTSYTVWLVGATETGDVRWRRSLSAGHFFAGSRSLAVGDTGPAVVVGSASSDSLSLLQFDAGGDLRWNRTHDVDASPKSLSATDDGYLLTGTAGFEHPWVLRTDEDGVVQHNRTYEELDVERLAGAVPTADGGIVFAGTYNANYRGSHPWAAKVGSDGVPRWSRVYATSSDVTVRSVFADGDGFTLVGSDATGARSDSATHLVGVGPNGSARYRERVDGLLQTVAVPGPNRTVTLAGYRGYPGRSVTSIVRSVSLPEPTAERDPSATTPLSSTGTYYRGQDLVVVRPSAAGETIDLVRVPGEYDDFDAHVVRRVELDADGRAVVESATLNDGQYYFETDEHAPLLVTSGWALTEGNRESATFDLESHRLRSDRDADNYVDRAANESTATVSISSERADYELSVSADRFRGDAVSAETLREMFPDALAVERQHGTPVARLAADSRTNVTVSVGSVDAGLYDLTFSGADTGDAGAVVERRLVVGTRTARPLSFSLGSNSLSVPLDGETSTNVTVEGVTDGIAAMSMSANRSGPPAIGLSLDVDINGSTASASAGWSARSADADAQSFGGDTANGSVVVGTFAADADTGSLDPASNATNTVQLRLDWVVDENGVPYTVPEGTTVTVTVQNIENATGEHHHRVSGSASASGSARSTQSVSSG